MTPSADRRHRGSSEHQKLCALRGRVLRAAVPPLPRLIGDLTLNGIGTAANLSPTSLSFGTVAILTTSAAKTVTLTNVGTTTLTISGIAITGTNAGDFAQTHNCGSSLAAQTSCSISLTFKPTASGARTAALSVTDNAAGSPQTVTLNGVGTTANLSPTSLSFGTIAILTTSAAKTVTLTNVGTTTLTISGIAIAGTNAGDFAQTHNCGSSLAAQTSCSISLTFKPTASGARTAALSVTDNAAGSSQAVSLGGIGSTGRCTGRGGQCASAISLLVALGWYAPVPQPGLFASPRHE